MIFDIKNRYCIGAGYVGGPTKTVIASKCPEINVNQADINPEHIVLLNHILCSIMDKKLGRADGSRKNLSLV